MNKVSLLSTVKKINPDQDLYLVSVYDVEPSGIIIHAYNQTNSKEYFLPVSENELAISEITRNTEKLAYLVRTITFVTKGTKTFLESHLETVSKIKQRPSGDEIEEMMKAPMMGEESESIQQLLVTGLMELCKVKPSGNDAIQWLGEWLIANNPNKPNVDEDNVEEPDDIVI